MMSSNLIGPNGYEGKAIISKATPSSTTISASLKSYRILQYNNSSDANIACGFSTTTSNPSSYTDNKNRELLITTTTNPSEMEQEVCGTAKIPNQNGNEISSSPLSSSMAVLSKTRTISGGGAAVAPTRTAATTKKIRRRKIKEFNDLISCYLCHGYLINPITIDYCMHSFCRSCILKHLKDQKFCPQCFGHSKELDSTNLRSDESLKGLVFKLVPGLYKKECERQLNFQNDNKLTDSNEMEDDEFFSPEEPISLSMEYHPKSIGAFRTEQLSPIRYLQCPAAVTVHHLKRFLCSKFDIDPDNERVEIEVIYEDEVLPENFSLIDVGYIYNWQRILPMRFFYQILVHNLTRTQIVLNANATIKIDNENQKTISETIRKRSTSDGQIVPNKMVRFKDETELTTKFEITPTTNEPKKMKYTVFKSKSLENNNNNPDNNKPSVNTNFNLNNNNNNYNNNVEKDDKKTDINKNEKYGNYECKNQVKIILSRSTNADGNDKYKQIIDKPSSTAVTTTTTPPPSSDFKSLRSNDARFNNNNNNNNDFPSHLQINRNNNNSTTTNSKSKNHSANTKKKSTNNSTSSSTTSSTSSNSSPTSLLDQQQKPVSKCDIVVSIPQTQIHRVSNSSDDSFENLSLAQLKTANKKGAVSPNGGGGNNVVLPSTVDFNEFHKYQPPDSIPKMKIDLPSLKTKFTVSKKSPKNSKNRKFSVEEPPQFSTHEVDLTTYAKVIGLKPITPIPNEKRNLNRSPVDESPVSSSGSSSVFTFTTATDNLVDSATIGATGTSHKKRKKGKHSKEPKDGKRRKLHAEISSQPADESLKFKLKLTGNHKVHKSDKKSSSSNHNNTPVVKTTNGDNSVSLQNELIVKNTNIVVDGSNKVTSTNHKLESVYKESTDLNNMLPPKIPIIQKLNNNNNNNNTNQKIVKSTLTTIGGNKPAPQSIIPASIASNQTPKMDGHLKVLPVSTIGGAAGQLPLPLPNVIATASANTKLPMSMPLPPSLFKTTPMTIQTITTTQAKPGLVQQQQPSRMPPTTQNTEIRHQMSTMVNRKVFIVPNPPRGIASSGPPKPFGLPTIASAAHRQAAQFKQRSPSLDSCSPALSKQMKMEQERLMHQQNLKPILPLLPCLPTKPITTTSAVALAVAVAPPSLATTTMLLPQSTTITTTTKRISPPLVISNTPVVPQASATNNIKPLEQFVYATPSYTTTTPTTQTTTLLPQRTQIQTPPSSVSVTKITEAFAPNLNHPSGLTITPHTSTTTTPQSFQFHQHHLHPQQLLLSHNQQQQHHYHHQPQQIQIQQSQKPALEIVRISSNIPPADQQKLMVTNNNTIKQIIPKTTRPPPPPIPLVKIKKTINQSQLNSHNHHHHHQLATNLNNKSVKVVPPVGMTTDGHVTTTSTTTITNNKPTESIEVLDLSGKSSRSPSREKSKSPLAAQPPQQQPLAIQKPSSSTTSKPQSDLIKDIKQIQTANSCSIDAALNKIKQQQNSYTNPKNGTSNVTNNSNNKDDNKATTTSDSHSGLQNLQLLSESATNCEKITINTLQKSLPKLPKLNEISKMRRNATVRQQNASVRNIPNPSALVSRNNQPIPMLASIIKTPSPPKLNPTITTTTVPVPIPLNITSTSTSAVQTTTAATTPTTTATPLVNFGFNLPSSSSPAASSSSSSSDPSKLIASKKNLHLEQLAANLNMRAAAAADNTAKTNAISSTTTNDRKSPPTTTTAAATTTTTTSAPATATTTIYTSVTATNNDLQLNNTIVSSSSSSSSATPQSSTTTSIYSTTIPLSVSSSSSSTTSVSPISASIA